jgi:tetratricopeptide (TPR) repeat protein
MELKNKIDEMAADAEGLLKGGNVEKAAALYRQIIVMAGDHHANVVILSLLRLGEISVASGNIDMAIECYREVEERSLNEGFTAGLLDAIQRRATLLMAAGRWDDALKAADNGAENASTLDETLYQMTFIGLLGQIERRIGNYDKALNYAMNGLKLAQKESNYEEELTFLSDMVLISLSQEDFKGAVKQAEMGIRRAQETNRNGRSVVFLGQKSQALLRLGKLDEARDIAAQGLEVAIENDTFREIATFHHDLAQIDLLKNDEKTALEHALIAYDIYRSLGNKEGILATLRTLNRTLLVTGDWDAAFRGLVDAMVLSVSMNRDLFFSTFRDISYFISVLCEKGEFDAIKSGIEIISVFFASIKVELSEGAMVPVDKITQPSYLTYVEELLSAFSYACDSKGDINSDPAKEALKVSASIDQNYGGDSLSLIKKFFR